MDERLSRIRIKRRITKHLGSELSEFRLILQVGSTVTFSETMAADIDLVGLSDAHIEIKAGSKRVFREKSEPDIEFSVFPTTLPLVIASNDTLSFYMFRERKKLEHSILIYGRKEDHDQLIEILTSLPFPSKGLSDALGNVDHLIGTNFDSDPNCQVAVFFSLLLILGYTHFPEGPAKPKWFFSQVRNSGTPSLEFLAGYFLGPFKSISTTNLIKDLENDRAFREFWQSRGTAWRDTTKLFDCRLEDSLICLLYCLHVYNKQSLSVSNVSRAHTAYRQYLDYLSIAGVGIEGIVLDLCSEVRSRIV